MYQMFKMFTMFTIMIILWRMRAMTRHWSPLFKSIAVIICASALVSLGIIRVIFRRSGPSPNHTDTSKNPRKSYVLWIVIMTTPFKLTIFGEQIYLKRYMVMLSINSKTCVIWLKTIPLPCPYLVEAWTKVDQFPINQPFSLTSTLMSASKWSW